MRRWAARAELFLGDFMDRHRHEQCEAWCRPHPSVPRQPGMPAPSRHKRCHRALVPGGKEQKPRPRSGLFPKAVTPPRSSIFTNGCWKRLFKIQQPLCLTTRSDLWYFLPKQFICLAEQLINSRAHQSRGLVRAGRQRGQMAAALAGLIQF